ncbi:hypothetical protein BO94DRAFT_109210 [Aspergillus sclerotioniger CBS 115572]|uniref:Transmembrane protein n=1 Tax=Aspergillus sclerotioniger CBS 115572 TaxID=1450535 RepID=A0A317WHV7_9EURO|nr:hypothetical protein BO94DRAFT_109210 [Aspergillus sclerotioniger CBS 115572]PWY84648.1 hypothetical protein BO94DRAFT_109210 [Aspergillus sclerotioniger CBS 115572]
MFASASRRFFLFFSSLPARGFLLFFFLSFFLPPSHHHLSLSSFTFPSSYLLPIPVFEGCVTSFIVFFRFIRFICVCLTPLFPFPRPKNKFSLISSCLPTAAAAATSAIRIGKLSFDSPGTGRMKCLLSNPPCRCTTRTMTVFTSRVLQSRLRSRDAVSLERTPDFCLIITL